MFHEEFHNIGLAFEASLRQYELRQGESGYYHV